MILAPVESVKVYRNNAVVRRKATAFLQEGSNELVIFGISSTADADSLRLFFPSTVLGKDVQILPLNETGDRLPSDEVEDEIVELQNRLDTLKTVEGLWITNGNFESRGECSSAVIEEYLDALPGHLESLRANRKEIEKLLTEAKEKQDKLKKKEFFRAIKLTIESSVSGVTDFEVEYSETNARWISTFEIHTLSDSKDISVLTRARITQSTGEDWENVILSLFTGNPAARQDIPVLKKLSLSFLPEPPKHNGAARGFMEMAAAGAMPPMMGMAMPAPVMKMAMETAEEVDADTMVGYALPGRRTIISDTTGSVADLKSDTIPAEKRIVCVPKLDSNAYLAAIIKTVDWPLKPSNAKLYLNENYCGEVYVAPDMTEEVYMLSFGKDERIALSRDVVRSKTEDVLLKGQKRKISEFALRITNNQDKALDVIVSDQIPVSSDKQIVVDHIDASGASIDEETGKLNWNLTVNGKSTVEKRLSYTVTYPKDKQLCESRSDVNSGLKICSKCGAYVHGKFCPECGEVI